jgi:hypothetical protein
MPLPLAALVALALGALFAHVARSELAQSDALLMSRPMGIVTGFAALVYAPAVGYFAAFHGDWAYMYLAPWRRIPSAVDLVLVAACAALVPAGFLIAAPFARAKRRSAVMASIGVPAALATLLALACEHRLATSATFVQYAHDFGTRPMSSTALGRAVLWAILVATASTLWAVRLLRAAPARKPGVAADRD